MGFAKTSKLDLTVFFHGEDFSAFLKFPIQVEGIDKSFATTGPNLIAEGDNSQIKIFVVEILNVELDVVVAVSIRRHVHVHDQ